MFASKTLPLFQRNLHHNFTRQNHRHLRRHYAKSLVVVEHQNNQLSAATLTTVSAAQKLTGPITAVVFSHSQDASANVVQQVSKLQGVSNVLVLNHPAFEHNTAEYLQKALATVQSKNQYTHILGAHTVFGKNLLPRLAASLDVSPVMDVMRIDGENVFQRPIYAGNALCTVESSDSVKVLTVRTTAFDKAATSGATEEAAAVSTDEEAVSSIEQLKRTPPQWISEELAKSDRPELASARVVVSGGRGLKNGENFKILYDLADKLGGAVGATRAAVDEGYVSNDLQVGQTGKIVAPELYIAVGVSGAIQHLAGMKDSKTIVAINKDPEAPIYQVADYGLVGDLFNVVPEMTQKL